MKPLHQIDSSLMHGTAVAETVDCDRRAAAQALVAARGWAPLKAFLVAVRGWTEPLASAYTLLGIDGGWVLDRREALDAGYQRGLLQ